MSLPAFGDHGSCGGELGLGRGLAVGHQYDDALRRLARRIHRPNCLREAGGDDRSAAQTSRRDRRALRRRGFAGRLGNRPVGKPGHPDAIVGEAIGVEELAGGAHGVRPRARLVGGRHAGALVDHDHPAAPRRRSLPRRRGERDERRRRCSRRRRAHRRRGGGSSSRRTAPHATRAASGTSHGQRRRRRAKSPWRWRTQRRGDARYRAHRRSTAAPTTASS